MSKPRNTPATCALCDGDHPANYKGCSVYEDLILKRNPRDRPNRTMIRPNQPPAQIIPPISNSNEPQMHYRTYADATQNKPNEQQTQGQQTQELGAQLMKFLEEFRVCLLN
ncbi:hypothetical protein HHI36_000462 [Cryptolaemus montrouzieri]|uniref:Uncharacterized protein n=1 Tax=Cryptolaemus montrouzieri TaxID=559131 RepID=A0ABD2P5Q6_9CUCU